MGTGRVVVRLLALLSAVLASVPAVAQLPERAPDRVIEGRITRDDHQHYIRVPFDVPPGTDRLVVDFDHDGRDDRTVIDLGIEDPGRFRGASGGSKRSFTIAESDATPSYLPGPLPTGRWHLALAVPNIREGVTARFTARVWFLSGAAANALSAGVALRGPGWYRGDLHLHSGHSDGSCTTRSGAGRSPCPLFRSLERAAASGLDFVAVTEHNTTSHHAALREAQPHFDRMLLIPGHEITTFHGHFNIFGVTQPIDFRIAPGIDNGFTAIARRVHDLGGILSINHPALPSGEACMGCGWTMPDFDPALVDMVEVMNGSTTVATGDPEAPGSGIPFWIDLARGGRVVVAVGGSDNHDPDRADAAAIGGPATVVHAETLSERAILDGLRAGRVFVDLAGIPSLRLDFAADAGGQGAAMGGSLDVAAGTPVRLHIDAKAPVGTNVELLDLDRHVRTLGLADRSPDLTLDRGRHFIRLLLRDPAGRLIALGNGISVTVR